MLKRVIDVLASIEGLQLVIATVVGLACLGYVGTSWIIHFISAGRSICAGAVAFVFLLLLGGAILRIPVATYTVFGGAIALGFTILSGASNVVMP